MIEKTSKANRDSRADDEQAEQIERGELQENRGTLIVRFLEKGLRFQIRFNRMAEVLMKIGPENTNKQCSYSRGIIPSFILPDDARN